MAMKCGVHAAETDTLQKRDWWNAVRTNIIRMYCWWRRLVGIIESSVQTTEFEATRSLYLFWITWSRQAGTTHDGGDSWCVINAKLCQEIRRSNCCSRVTIFDCPILKDILIIIKLILTMLVIEHFWNPFYDLIWLDITNNRSFASS